MDGTNQLQRHGHRLLQLGLCLLLLTSCWGFVFPQLSSPSLGLSAHKLASLLAPLFIGVGLVWPRLQLGRTCASAAYWLFLYSSLAIVGAYVLGAVSGAGGETMPLAVGNAHGSPEQEMAIRIAAYSSAPTGIVAFGLILWGLRHMPQEADGRTREHRR